MNLHTASDLGALVRDWRSRLGLTQQELARRVGVSRAWIVALEKGKSSAQIGLVLRTLKELGVALQVEAEASSSYEGVDINSLVDGHVARSRK